MFDAGFTLEKSAMSAPNRESEQIGKEPDLLRPKTSLINHGAKRYIVRARGEPSGHDEIHLVKSRNTAADHSRVDDGRGESVKHIMIRTANLGISGPI
jgi:hypothetical protein